MKILTKTRNREKEEIEDENRTRKTDFVWSSQLEEFLVCENTLTLTSLAEPFEIDLCLLISHEVEIEQSFHFQNQ